MSDLPVPGTVRLIDAGGDLSVKHGSDKADIVLIPQPSSDPDDPLNWSWRRKAHNRVWQILWTFIGVAITCALAPAYPMIEADTGIPAANITTGVGLMYLFLGWGNVIVQPWAMHFGRRQVLLASLLATSLTVLWSAYVKSSGEWYANRIMMGISNSPVETLVEILVTDLSFTHERGVHMSAYTWTLFNGAFLAPIASGYIAENLGWQWIQWIGTIIGVVTTISMFFSFEETMFYRKTGPVEFLQAQGGSKDIEEPQEPTGGEKSLGESRKISPPATENDIATGETTSSISRSQRYLRTLRLWGFRTPDQPGFSLKLSLLPFGLLRYPVIWFSGIWVGSVLSWFNVLNATTAENFGGEPYNFTTNQTGLTYLANVIGSTIGCFLAGSLSDIVAEALARRNQGIKEPEHRLWLALIPLVLHPAGFFLYGIGAAQKLHWVALVFGVGLISATLPMGSLIALNYVIDCYKEAASEAIVAVILIRNTMGFVITYAISPMISDMGLQNAFILVGCLGAAIWGTCLLVIWFGKSWRTQSARSYWNIVEEHNLQAH
ncbi:major facilitator superfamily domain-containing protein [Aspergillus karnatakaensis]|uniref:major facilitator superfamily domain-containing protein n=1 Tax=Aspergillus karnatakaensis TaxID=1810916 RepID=UPI003CCE475D